MSSEEARHPDSANDDVDVEKALLQGMTYAEMQEQCEAPCEVNLTLPPCSAAIFRQVPSYESYDEQTDCFHCIKPASGC